MSSATVTLPRPRVAPATVRERTLRLRPALAGASLLVTTACGVLLALAGAAAHSPVLPAPIHRLPRWIDSPLAGAGVHLTAGRYYVVLVAMALAYGATAALAPSLRARWVLGAVLLLDALFVLAPPLLSTDVFNYVIYGRMGALHGLDPYQTVPLHLTHDPLYPYIAWRHQRSAYGPLFTFMSYGLAHLSPAAAVWSFKALAAGAGAGCTALVWHLARRLGRSPARAVALFGLNPLVLVWAIAPGHNDMLMLLGMLGAVALVLAGRPASGGVALVAAAAVKLTAGVAAPFLVLGARRRLDALAGLVAAGSAVVIVTLFAFADHATGLFVALRRDERMSSFDGIPHAVAGLFGVSNHPHAIRTVATAAFALVLVWLIVRVIRGADWIAACGWAFLALVVSSTWLLGWYTIWPLPFAAIARDRRLLLATLGLNAYYLANHAALFMH